ADDDDDAARHIFAAMVARAFDHRDRARIADRGTFARDAANIALVGNRTVEHGVADDDALLGRHVCRFARWIDDDAPARETLADIIIGLPFELERHPMREPGAEALAGRAVELHMHRL